MEKYIVSKKTYFNSDNIFDNFKKRCKKHYNLN